MFYLKRNLTGLERFARLALALCLAYVVYARVPAGWLALGAHAAAVLTACTAAIGFCPACAMAGRKPIVPEA
jgi:Protein of unknown function (DUF2892)